MLSLGGVVSHFLGGGSKNITGEVPSWKTRVVRRYNMSSCEGLGPRRMSEMTVRTYKMSNREGWSPLVDKEMTVRKKT